MPSVATPEEAPTWAERTRLMLEYLADHPHVLLAVLLAVSAVTRPYANIAHDTRLYSVQVLNRVEGGSYDNDLFFRHGSQDRYSLFSPLLAPLVSLIGLEWAFFLVYLAGNCLLIAALIRLVLRLVENRPLAIIVLLYLVIAPLNYGGLYILHVHEPFLTPRMLAVALVLWGFDRLLDGRHGVSLVLMLLAGLLHPLMAVGGWLVWAGIVGVDKLGWKWASLTVASVSVAVAVVLASPSLGERVLGTMDDTWRDVALRASSFNFASEWEPRDWLNIVLSWLGLAAGYYLCKDLQPRQANFYLVVAVVGVAAVFGTILAAQLPYALLLQGQPYRALWILKVFQVPLCFVLAERLWSSKLIARQVLALVLLGFFACSTPLLLEWCMPLFFLPIVLVFVRGLEHTPRRPDWLMHGVAVSLVLGVLAWALFKEQVIFAGRQEILRHQDTFELVQTMIQNFGALPWIVVILAMLVTLYRPGRTQPVLGAALAVFVAANLLFFAANTSQYARLNHSRHLPDILFARDFLREHQAPTGRFPNVYSPYGRIEYVWLEMKANSYFDWWQASGFIFQRQTALEGQRRALVVGPFEVARYREVAPFLDEHVKRDVRRFFERGLDSPEPTVADLIHLCSEPELDYAVLKQEFPGLYAATNGQVYIYDCRQVSP